MKINALFLALLCVLCLSSCFLDTELKGISHVICIGFDYADMAVPTLYGTKNDALETGACFCSLFELGKTPYTLQTVLERTSSDQIFNLADQTVKQSNPEDQIIFYFSGHGDLDDQGFFLAAGKTEELAYSKLYLHQILELFESGCCQCTIILDTCHSGSVSDFSDSSVFSALEKVDFKHTSIICSCLEEEISMESSALSDDGTFHSHGYFTLQMLKALGWIHSGVEGQGYIGKNPGRVTAQGLISQIYRNSGSRFQHPIGNITIAGSVLVP